MPKIKSSIEEEPNDSFTSMIDIVFLLLIFFILQPFKSPEMKLRSELPKDSGPSNKAMTLEMIQLRVVPKGPNKEDGYYNVSGKRVEDAERLYRALLSHSNGDQNVPVVIDASPDVHFRFVLWALDQCYKAEMRDVKFSAPPPPNAKRNPAAEGAT